MTTQLSTLDRIKDEAYQNSRGWLEVQYSCARQSYEKGAKSERNKVIEELLHRELSIEAPTPKDIFTFTREELERMKV